MSRLACVLLAGLLWLDPGSVQAASCQNNIPPTHPDTAYIDHGDGTVTDTRTGLMWKKCSEGLVWDSDSNGCNGNAASLKWGEAMATAAGSDFAGHDDWRLPNLKELHSLIETCRISPAINTDLFPATPVSEFWSNSPPADTPNRVWILEFDQGLIRYSTRYLEELGRFVRGGQSFTDAIFIDDFEPGP